MIDCVSLDYFEGMDIRPNFKYHTLKNPFLSTLFELRGEKCDCRPVEFLWMAEMVEEDAKQRRPGAEMTKKTKQLIVNRAKTKKEKDEERELLSMQML